MKRKYLNFVDHVLSVDDVAGGFHELQHLPHIAGPLREHLLGQGPLVKGHDAGGAVNLEEQVPTGGDLREVGLEGLKGQAQQLRQARAADALVVAGHHAQVVLHHAVAQLLAEEVCGLVAEVLGARQTTVGLELRLAGKGRGHDLVSGEQAQRLRVQAVQRQGLENSAELRLDAVHHVALVVVKLGGQQEKHAALQRMLLARSERHALGGLLHRRGLHFHSRPGSNSGIVGAGDLEK